MTHTGKTFITRSPGLNSVRAYNFSFYKPCRILNHFTHQSVLYVKAKHTFPIPTLSMPLSKPLITLSHYPCLNSHSPRLLNVHFSKHFSPLPPLPMPVPSPNIVFRHTFLLPHTCVRTLTKWSQVCSLSNPVQPGMSVKVYPSVSCIPVQNGFCTVIRKAPYDATDTP